MVIIVKNLQNQTFQFEINEEDTVLDLKMKIKKNGSKYDVPCQKLIYGGTRDMTSMCSSKFKESQNVGEDKNKEFSVGDEDEEVIQDYEYEEVIEHHEVDICQDCEDGVCQYHEVCQDCEDGVCQYHEVCQDCEDGVCQYHEVFQDCEDKEHEVKDFLDCYLPSIAADPIFQSAWPLLVNDENALNSFLTHLNLVDPVLYEYIYDNSYRIFEFFKSEIGSSSCTVESKTQDVMQDPVQSSISNAKLVTILKRSLHYDPLIFLNSSPAFQQMILNLRSNPNVVDEYLYLLSQTNPEDLWLITQNSKKFVEILNNPPAELASTTINSGGQKFIQVKQDLEAINRLAFRGFPEKYCAEAYFGCNKDENLAVTYLIAKGLSLDQ